MQRNLLRHVATLAGGLLAANAYAQEQPAFDSEKDKLSYALGADIGEDLRDRSVDVAPELLFKGISDALSGGRMLMTDQEIVTTISSLRQKLALAARNLADENKRKGAEFLEANKTREGVITLENGLQYKILEPSNGPKPTADDRVVVNYRGTLIDGTEFDSSYARNQPGTFPIKRVIKGWRGILPLMPVGSRWQLFIPSHLAYGTHGAGRKIGPNATLIFELQLIAISDSADGALASPGAGSTGAVLGASETAQAAADLTDIVILFKVDPRLMGGTYAKQGWVTPQIYQGISGQDTVEAKVDGLDAMGRSVSAIAAEWIPEDPDLVTVSAGVDRSVRITVRGPGQSSLKVVYGDLAKTLSIKATSDDDVLRIEISQL